MSHHPHTTRALRAPVVAAASLAAIVAVTAILATPAQASPVATRTAAIAHGSGPLTTAQALLQAKIEHTTVPVTSATTPTQTVTANPDGSVTVNTTLAATPGTLGTHATASVVHQDANSGWATINRTFHGRNYFDATADAGGHMQVGDEAGFGGSLSRSLVKFPISAVFAGATISSATLGFTETGSASCTSRAVTLYAPAKQLTQSNATWDAWSGVALGSPVATQTVAHGHNATCPVAGVPFDVTSVVQADVAANATAQTFVLKAANETNTSYYKEFAAPTTSTPVFSVTYDHVPATPSAQTTSPTTDCAASPATVIGDGPITLKASVSDLDGESLGVTFTVQNSATGAVVDSTDPATSTVTPPTTVATHIVAVAKLEAAAAGVPTTFTWTVQTTDGTLSSHQSTTCAFTFDPRRPTGAPRIVPPTGTVTIGVPVTIEIDQPDSGPAPTTYQYQLNSGPFTSIPATGTGVDTITITPTRPVNTLNVTGLISGNFGPSANAFIDAQPGPPATDGDMNGDGKPDLLAVGDAHGVPEGLWLAPGTVGGAVNTDATNIGVNGNGVSSQDSSDFDGAQVLTGHFTGGSQQDVMVFYPSGAHAGGAFILNGTGDGSPFQPQLSGNEHTVSSDFLADNNGFTPQQLAVVGDTSQSGDLAPDLVGVSGTTGSYYLNFYVNPNLGNYQILQMTNSTPTGDMDWSDWTLAGCICANTTNPAALFLWNHVTGALYLWENLSLSDDWSSLTVGNQYLLSSSWQTGDASLQAGDLNGDGTPDLWSVGSGGVVTANLVGDLSGTSGTITAQPSQTLNTDN